MPMNKKNTRTFHRLLYVGMLETVTLLKRDDNQRQGTVTSYTLHQCRQGQITKTGQTIQGDMISDHRVTWHIPAIEMDRIGVAYLNPLDRIVDGQGRHWQPESTTSITIKLFQNHFCVDCLRVDPPGVSR